MHASIPAVALLLCATAYVQSPTLQGAAQGGPTSQFALQVVQLQPTSPGTAQVGNINVSGAVLAGSFTGSGASLTNLNAASVATGTLNDARLSTNVARLSGTQTFTGAKTFSSSVLFSAAGAAFAVANSTKIDSLNCDLLDGLDSSAFLQAIPMPLVLTSNAGTPIEGSSSVDSYAGIYGHSTAPSYGAGIAGYSANGLGVTGWVDSGEGISGYAQVIGRGASGTSVNGTGVYGLSYGGGYGVSGESYSLNSAVYGLNSSGGPGVEGNATQGNNGVTGRADYPFAVSGGVYGEHNGGFYGLAGRSTYGNIFGNDIGVWGETYGLNGWAMYANGRMLVNGDLYVAGAKVGCVTDIVKNGGNEPLELGDVVEIMGADDPVLGELPVVVVRKATSANATGVLGPISSALRVTENTIQPPPVSDPRLADKGPALPRYQFSGAEGAIAPGGYGQVVTLGSFKRVKVDASYGEVRPGTLLVASPNPGYAMAARAPELGTVIGKSLGALAGGQGEVPLLVHQQ